MDNRKHETKRISQNTATKVAIVACPRSYENIRDGQAGGGILQKKFELSLKRLFVAVSCKFKHSFLREKLGKNQKSIEAYKSQEVPETYESFKAPPQGYVCSHSF